MVKNHKQTLKSVSHADVLEQVRRALERLVPPENLDEKVEEVEAWLEGPKQGPYMWMHAKEELFLAVFRYTDQARGYDIFYAENVHRVELLPKKAAPALRQAGEVMPTETAAERKARHKRVKETLPYALGGKPDVGVPAWMKPVEGEQN